MFTVPILRVLTKCSLFEKNPTVQFSVTLSVLGEFVSQFEWKVVNIKNTNFPGLERLCEEFG
jgi:hypothetical protein